MGHWIILCINSHPLIFYLKNKNVLNLLIVVFNISKEYLVSNFVLAVQYFEKIANICIYSKTGDKFEVKNGFEIKEVALLASISKTSFIMK